MSADRQRRRKLIDVLVRSCCVLACILALIPLFSVLYYVTVRGISGVNLDFFTELPKPVGEPGGGMANAIVGTLELVGLACLFGIPPGVLAGVYLSEFGDRAFGRAVRFSADVLSGVPSITSGHDRHTLAAPHDLRDFCPPRLAGLGLNQDLLANARDTLGLCSPVAAAEFDG